MSVLHQNEASIEIKRHSRPLPILAHDRISKYKESPMYHQLMKYLKRGEDRLNELGIPKERKKMLRHQAKSHQLSYETNRLYFVEATGAKSICLVEKKIDRFLKAAHEDHGHFASALTLDYLIGRAYWPTRVKDVEA